MEIVINILGWIGTALIIAAYYLVSVQKLNAQSPVYQWLNLIGALGVGANVFIQKAWPAFALETIWALIAVFALLKQK